MGQCVGIPCHHNFVSPSLTLSLSGSIIRASLNWDQLKLASDGMSDNNLGDRSGIPGGSAETEVSRGQAALRRIMLGDSRPDSSLTPEGSGKRHTRMGSVSVQSFSPVQNFRFRNSTVDVFGIRPITSDVGCGSEPLFHGE